MGIHQEQPRQTIVSVKNLTKRHSRQTVLNNISFDLHEGDVVLLHGPNGAGKTTLLNILTGNTAPDHGTVEFFVNNQLRLVNTPSSWWARLNPVPSLVEKLAAIGIGRSWQNVRLFPSQSLRDNVAVAMPNQPGENPLNALVRAKLVFRREAAVRREAASVLRDLGLGGREGASADKISLGQSKKVAIARAVLAGARTLFLDEPLAGLDNDGIQQIVGFLKQLQSQHSLTLVIVEHAFNIPHLLPLATVGWKMNSGQLTVQSAKDIWNGSLQNKTSLGLACESVTQDLKKISEIHIDGAVLHLFAKRPLPNEPILFEVQNLVVHRGGRLVIGTQLPNGSVKGISFTLYRGMIGILSAPNGWGKTTLLEALAGTIQHTSGEICLAGESISRLKPWDRAKKGIRYVRSTSYEFCELKVEEMFQLFGGRRIPEELVANSHKPFSQLSGGERKMAHLYTTVVDDSFGLLDEPFLGLDAERLRRVITDLFKKARGCIVVIPSELA